MFLVRSSKNEKLGPVSATYAPIAQTCPTTCPFRGAGCYAEMGNVGTQMRRIERTVTLGMNGDTVAILEGDEIADQASHVPPGRALRLHVSGDAITDFRAQQMARGASAWRGPVWSYTHAWREVKRESWGTVSVLASCETPGEAEEALEDGWAAAIVVDTHPSDGKAWYRSSDTGRDEPLRIIPCPAQTRDDITCADCRLCWDDKRLRETHSVIAFAAHGSGRKRALKVLAREAGG